GDPRLPSRARASRSHAPAWRGRETDLDGEASFGLGPRGDARGGGGRDGSDDREAEAEPRCVARPGRPESLERLKDPLELAGGDLGAGVRDGEESLAVAALGSDLDAATALGVADSVAEEGRDEAFDEARVAGRLGGLEASVESESLVVHRRGGGGYDCSEVDGLVAVDAALAAGER